MWMVLRVWNWLLHTVSTETSVHDVLWSFLSAMTSYRTAVPNAEQMLNCKNPLLTHPWRLCLLAGNPNKDLLCQFHSFLYAVTSILRNDMVDPSLRRLCFKTWMFQLTPHEQHLILNCHLLSCVGWVMSEHEDDSSWNENTGSQFVTPDLEKLDDLTGTVRIETSSRAAMSVCLTDGTTDTFWESGEEDKNRAKIITLTLSTEAADVILLSIYVNNIRDETCRTSQILVSASNTSCHRKKLLCQPVDNQFKGWIKCCISGHSHFYVELKGPDPFLRIRLLQVSGHWKEGDKKAALLKPSPSYLLQFSAAQSDAFALFQAIAAQAFSNEFSEDQNGILRQQVLDILFSRVQLHPLQGYVCLQVVLALEREIDLLKDQLKRNYSYCSGLLVMLARICSSRCGREVFSSRNNLLSVLSELLLFASPILQAQAIDTIEKLMPVFDPEWADCKTLILNLLAVIAKVISLQVRERNFHTVSGTKLQLGLGQDAPSGWRLDRPCSLEIGRLICCFLSDAASEKFGPVWSRAVREHLATHIMNMVTIPDDSRSSRKCLKLKRFWLALAALSVLKDTSWLQSSPAWQAQTSKQNPLFCDNHDDGKTEAHLYCQVCGGSFCRPCYTILHLNKRNRNHTVQMIAGNESRPHVNVHEGCTRLRLPWLLCLLDSASLNGMAEFWGNQLENLFHLDTEGVIKLCRFCQNPTGSDFSDVCQHAECQSLIPTACTGFLPCGHLCGGISGEDKCLPCLQCRSDASLRQDADDLCVICFTDRLGGAPCIQLSCGHVFHFDCCKATLSKRWPGPRITFAFMRCPLCQKHVQHPALNSLLEPLNALYEEVSSKARLRLDYDGLTSCPAITSPTGPFNNNPIGYALERYVYVLCHKGSFINYVTTSVLKLVDI